MINLQSPLLTYEEAAVYLRLDACPKCDPVKTVKRYCKRGLLKRTRIGDCYYIRIAELDSFIERQEERKGGQNGQKLQESVQGA